MSISYQGPAVLIHEGGGEQPAYVDLWVEWDGALKRWLGTATLDDPRHVTLGAVRLRLPDGREGRALIGSLTSDSAEVDVTGSGPAPWWESAP